MTALVLNPNDFSIVMATGDKPEFLLNDEPGLVWRTNNLGAITLVVELDGQEIDTVALAGTNLLHGNTVRIRLGATQAEINSGTAPVDITTGIANGTPMIGNSFVIQKLDAPDAYLFMRLDIVATGNAVPYVDVSRLLIGKSVNCDGVDVGAELNYVNNTNSALDPKRTKPLWKVTVSGFTEATKFGIWHPLLLDLGDQHGFLFVPYLEGDFVQEQAVFGFISTQSKGTASNSDYWVIDLQVQSII